jgi:Flp pilus assembly protein TadG
MKPTSRAPRRRRPDSGEALVEMALVLPILIVLSMGMLDFGRAFHAKSVLDQAAREGARVAVVTGPPLDPGPAQTRVANVLTAAGMTGGPAATVSAVDGDHMVTVTVTYNFQFVTPGVFSLIGANYGNQIVMTGKSSMRYEDGN